MPRRRMSPQWVRELPSRTLHALAFKLQRLSVSTDLSPGQEWLFEACVSELEYRRRTTRWPEVRCTCQLCFGPFEFGDD